jgi:DMSO/TMAO reductase YedYZ molybdopterin-dependent catalytic subunit
VNRIVTFVPRVVRTADPENSEFPFAELRSWITPVEQFYVRNHFPVPGIDPSTWRLAVGGKDLSLDDLESMTQRSVVATLECAGNGRVFNDPPVPGVPWRNGAVSNGEWSGPSLREVLAAAGARDAAHVHLAGADRGNFRGREIDFVRSIPREKALDPDTLVALRLNGEPLTPDHGAPARAVVPGWYGMASVKWLMAIEPREEPSDNPFMTEDYTRMAPGGGIEPLDWMEPKAQIARPAENAVVAGPVLVEGAAWSGRAPVVRVELSDDEGASWSAAELDGPDERWAWRLWRWTWNPGPGRHALLVRAVDAAGRTQPSAPDPSSPGYINHWIRPYAIEVA